MRSFIIGCYPESLQGYAPLILRVVTGLVFAIHGYQKFEMGIPGVSGFLAGLGFPLAGVFAVLLIAAELFGGIFLILGFLHCWSARILSFVALVALLTVHLSKGFYVSAGGYEYILLILAASISLAITGPGKWALDHKVWKR